MYRWCKGSSDALKIQRRLVHEENLGAAPQAILVANHLSSLDIIILGGFLRRDYRWMAKSTLFKVPFSGWYLNLAGHIPVRRDLESEARIRLVNQGIERVVNQGASVLFFPEGTRSPDGQLMAFRMGAFVAAAKHDLPIIPLVLRGTHELMEKGANDLEIRADRSCSVTVLEPIRTSNIGPGTERARAEALRALCFDAFAAELECTPSEHVSAS
jgi:1-acyl-sn-glycerol-3-phosphate acyltransferase